MPMLALLTDVKTILGIAASDTTRDALITRRINAAGLLIESLCGRAFSYAEYTQPLACEGQARIWANNAPINLAQPVLIEDTSGTTVQTINDTAVTASTGEIELDWALPDYRDTAGMIRAIPVGGGPLSLSLVYYGGYVLPGGTTVTGVPSLPADLQSLCEDLACAGFASAGRDGSITGETLGSYSWSRASGADANPLSPSQLAVISSYRRLV